MTTNDVPRPARAPRRPSGVLGTVTITAREIYDAVMRLTARVDTALERGELVEQQVKDHESRIRSLEHLRWPLPSVAAIVSLGALIVALVK